MLSTQKPLLVVAEMVTLIGWTSLIAGGIGVAAGEVDPERLRMPLLIAAVLAFPVFFLAIALQIEYVRCLRGSTYDPDDENTISWAEARRMVHWCPRLLKATPLLALITLALTFLPYGNSAWSSSQPLDGPHAINLCCFIATFCLFSQSVISSASRMPGSFSDHFCPAPARRS